jgi:hypothetical protein
MDTKNNMVRMTFLCNQNWEEMDVSVNGRFCSICNQEVIDFAKITNGQLNRIKEKDNVLCGRFSIEQVDNDVIAPIEIPKKVKTLGLFASLFFAIIAKNSFGQNVVQLNNTEIIKLSDTLTVRESKIYKDSISKSQENIKKLNKRKTFTILRRKYYFTKRFPFIKKAIPRVMGRFRMD